MKRFNFFIVLFLSFTSISCFAVAQKTENQHEEPEIDLAEISKLMGDEESRSELLHEAEEEVVHDIEDMIAKKVISPEFGHEAVEKVHELEQALESGELIEQIQMLVEMAKFNKVDLEVPEWRDTVDAIQEALKAAKDADLLQLDNFKQFLMSFTEADPNIGLSKDDDFVAPIQAVLKIVESETGKRELDEFLDENEGLDTFSRSA